MKYVRMPIEVESPEEFGYGRIRYNLSESSVADRKLSDLGSHHTRPHSAVWRASRE